MAYYTLVDRVKGTKTWAVQFGAKERSDVEFERDAQKQSDKDNGFSCQYRILKTTTMRQSEIDKAVKALNAKG